MGVSRVHARSPVICPASSKAADFTEAGSAEARGIDNDLVA